MIGFTYAKGHSVFCVEGNSWRGRIGGRLENYRHSLGKRCCCLGPWLEQRKELAMAVLNIRSWAKNTVRKWDGSCNSRVNFPNIWQLTLNTKIPFQKKCVFMGIIQNSTKHFLIFSPLWKFCTKLTSCYFDSESCSPFLSAIWHISLSISWVPPIQLLSLHMLKICLFWGIS